MSLSETIASLVFFPDTYISFWRLCLFNCSLSLLAVLCDLIAYPQTRNKYLASLAKLFSLPNDAYGQHLVARNMICASIPIFLYLMARFFLSVNVFEGLSWLVSAIWCLYWINTFVSHSPDPIRRGYPIPTPASTPSCRCPPTAPQFKVVTTSSRKVIATGCICKISDAIKNSDEPCELALPDGMTLPRL